MQKPEAARLKKRMKAIQLYFLIARLIIVVTMKEIMNIETLMIEYIDLLIKIVKSWIMERNQSMTQSREIQSPNGDPLFSGKVSCPNDLQF